MEHGIRVEMGVANGGKIVVIVFGVCANAVISFAYEQARRVTSAQVAGIVRSCIRNT